MSDVAAVVVNFNAGTHLRDCVASLRAAGVVDIVVVDNASTDASVADLLATDPAVRLVETARNLGYGGGANRGLAQTDAPFVLICNPDVVVETATVKGLRAAIDADVEVGIVGPRIDEADTGELYPSARRFPSVGDALGHAFVGLVTQDNPFSRRYLMRDADPARPRRVDWVSGACFLARRDALASLGGFDEAYFMYLEDVDLCWRAWRQGWSVAYEPSVRAVHVQGVSTGQAPYRMLYAHHRSLLRYWWRTTRWPARAAAPVIAAGIALRLTLMTVRRALGLSGHG